MKRATHKNHLFKSLLLSIPIFLNYFFFMAVGMAQDDGYSLYANALFDGNDQAFTRLLNNQVEVEPGLGEKENRQSIVKLVMDSMGTQKRMEKNLVMLDILQEKSFDLNFLDEQGLNPLAGWLASEAIYDNVPAGPIMGVIKYFAKIEGVVLRDGEKVIRERTDRYAKKLKEELADLGTLDQRMNFQNPNYIPNYQYSVSKISELTKLLENSNKLLSEFAAFQLQNPQFFTSTEERGCDEEGT